MELLFAGIAIASIVAIIGGGVYLSIVESKMWDKRKAQGKPVPWI